MLVMERRLVQLLFITGFISHILSVPRKYYLIQQEKNWTDAQAYCRATYTDLAIVESNDNMLQLQNEAQRQHFSSSAWVGLYNDINSWRWSMGNEPLGSFRSWEEDEPNNLGGDQECAVLWEEGWNDRACTEEWPFVCFDDTKTDRYIYISNETSWFAAQDYCRTHHTDLASGRNAMENSAVVTLTSDYTWFGLFRDSWKWTDRTNFSSSVISWMSGKPDNDLGDENCAYLNDCQAVDAECSDTMPFFCYSTIRKQQIMRVKVQSRQDANDPVVKESILEQIKQKLKAHGMLENITMTWREEPDGVVFNKEK